MSERTPPVLERLRRPEYTGENRCVPCTAVNLVLALAGSLLLALASRGLAVAAFLAALGVIYLRGYLVPGTPALTKRYLPERVLALFGKDPAAERAEESWETIEKLRHEREHAVDAEAYLLEAGAVEPVEPTEDDASPGPSSPGAGGPPGGGTDDLDESAYRLTDDFEAAVARGYERRASDPRDPTSVAALFGVEPEDVTDKDRDYPAFRVEYQVRKWPTDAALRLDVAAHEALVERTDDWMAVPLEQRRRLLQSLRELRTTCPDCGGAVDRSEETVESCCRAGEVITLACADCELRLREYSYETEVRGPSV